MILVLIDGVKVSKKRIDKLTHEISLLHNEKRRIPKLSVILVGDDPASQTYVKAKENKCRVVKMLSKTHHLKSDCSEEELLALINKLNTDPTVDGILVQLPLPKHICESKVINAIDCDKDVDGLNILNVGRLELNEDGFVPCTPRGIMTLLKEYKIDLEGKRALVIGRSRLVGNPISTLLKHANATVTQAHSYSKDLRSLINENELIIVAIGKREFIKADMLNENHIVIDVGIHRENGKLYGDVEKDAYESVKMITPVPKGVGPMTIVSLLENTYDAYLIHEGMK